MASAVDFQHPKVLDTFQTLPTLQTMYSAPPHARLSLLASSPYCNSKQRRAPMMELHPIDLATWDDGAWGDDFFMESQPDDIDEPWPYRFMSEDTVWVCSSDGEWIRGKIVGQAKQGKTRSDNGLFWCAEYHVPGKVRARNWFAPLNGDIKPDSKHTHRLLLKAGWFVSDNDE